MQSAAVVDDGAEVQPVIIQRIVAVLIGIVYVVMVGVGVAAAVAALVGSN